MKEKIKKVVTKLMLFSILLQPLQSLTTLKAKEELKKPTQTIEKDEKKKEINFNEEIFSPIEYKKTRSKRSIRSVENRDMVSYIRENVDKKIIKGKLYDKFKVQDALNVTSTVIDGKIFKNAKFTDLYQDKDKDGKIDNIDSYLNQTTGYVPLFEISKESEYLVARATTKYINAKVTDVGFAKHNDKGEVIKDCIYDYKTGLSYIPKKYISEKKQLYTRMQTLITVDDIKDARAEMEIFVNNKNVKGVLAKNGTAMGNLGAVSTDIILSNTNKEKITEDKIDSIEINGFYFTKKDKVFKYDEKCGKLEIFLSPAGVTEIKINLSDSFMKETKKTLNKLNQKVASLFNQKSYAANVPGVIEIKGELKEDWTQSFYLDASITHDVFKDYSGYVSPYIVRDDSIAGDYESKTPLRVQGEWGVAWSDDEFVTGKASYNYPVHRHAHVSAQTIRNFKFPEMFLDLICGHYQVEFTNSKWYDTIKLVIRGAKNGELVIGALTPTYGGQVGCGFFKIRYEIETKRPPDIDPPNDTKIWIKKLDNDTYRPLSGAKFILWTEDMSGDYYGGTAGEDYYGPHETGSDGYTPRLPIGNTTSKKWYAKEISAPYGYELDSSTHNLGYIKAGDESKYWTFYNKKEYTPPKEKETIY